jgi:sugar diacid utilization regulator
MPDSLTPTGDQRDGDPAASAATLNRIVESLGSSAVKTLVPARAPDAQVTGPRIYDPMDPSAIGPHEVVLAVNLASTSVRELVIRAAEAGAVAIALKLSDPLDDEIASLATHHGIGVLAVATDVTWDQVFRVIHTFGAAWAATGDEETPIRDLFALANAIAALVGGAVTIEDPRSTLLAYSNLDQPIDDARRETILGRGHGSDWARRIMEVGAFRPLVASPGTVLQVRDPASQARPRLAASVGAGGELLGFIWAVEGDRCFTEKDEDALRATLPLAALHILRHRSGEDLTRRQRGKVMRDALQNTVAAEALGEALGIDSHDPCAVAAFRLVVEDSVELTVKRARAIDIITIAAEAFRRRVVCAWIDDSVYVLFPSLRKASPARLVGLTGTIAAQARTALDVDIIVGIGSTVDGLADLRVSRDEADRVVRVLSQGHQHREIAAHVDDLRIPTILLALKDLLRDRVELRLPQLETLERADAEHGSEYMATLKAYAMSAGNITSTAKQLSLHPNSVRYRLAKAQEVSGLDAAAPDTLSVLALHFHVRDGTPRRSPRAP